MPKVTFDFTVNGTQDNPYADLFGLRYNPFPHHGTRGYDRVDLAFASLAEPIKSADDIRKRLSGALVDEVIEHVIQKFYKPGECVDVKLTLHWPDGR